MKFLKYILPIAIGTIIMAGVVYAAPTFRVERTIIPEADSTYDLGSSSVKWANVYVDTITGLTDIDVTNATATNATTTNLFTSNLTIGSLTGFLKATAGVVSTALIDLAADITGVLPIANGGTNASSQTTNGVNYFNGTSITSGTGLVFNGTNLGVGSSTPGSLLSIGNTGWNFLDGATATSTASGHLRVKGNLQVDGASIFNAQIKASNLSSALLQVDANGIAAEYAGTSCTNQFVRALSALGIATCASVDLAADVTGTLPVANGGTGLSTVATNSLLTGNGTSALTAESALTFDGNTLTVNVNGSANAVDITQAGSGTSLNINNSGSGDFFVVDTSKFIVKNSGNVGIATTTPWGHLSIEGQGTNPSFVVSDTGNITDFIVTAAGNVGIGTALPDSKLDLVGSGFPLIINSTDSNGLKLKWEDNGTVAGYAGASTVLGHSFYVGDTNANTQFVIRNSTGNVGIGTTSPDTKLEVAGEITALGADNTFLLKKDNVSTGLYANAGGNLSFWVNGGQILTFEAGSANLGNFTTNPAYRFETQGSNDQGYFGVTNSTSGDIFEINSSGNVGIATSTPLGKLSIEGDGTTTGFLFTGANSSGQQRISFLDNGKIGLGTTTPTARLHLVRLDSETSLFKISDATGRPTFSVSDSGVTKIREYGLVKGLGLLNIFGSMYIESFSPNQTFYDQSGGGDYPWQVEVDGGQFRIQTDTNADDVYETRALTLQSGVRAGFRDSTPDFALETVGSNTNGYFGITNSTDGDILTVDTSGRFGIGTTTPQSKLDINGSARTAQKTLTDGATITVDVSTGNKFRVTLGGNRAIDFTNVSSNRAGQSITLELCQDGTGSRTVTWDADTIFVTGSPLETTFTAPTLSTTANVCNVFGGHITNGTSTTRVMLGY